MENSAQAQKALNNIVLVLVVIVAELGVIGLMLFVFFSRMGVFR
jgi:hypothetical protein